LGVVDVLSCFVLFSLNSSADMTHTNACRHRPKRCSPVPLSQSHTAHNHGAGVNDKIVISANFSVSVKLSAST